MSENVHIGILTYYYRTHNYGGILQAYALTKFLQNEGFSVEQICCTRDDERPFEQLREEKQQIVPFKSRLRATLEHRTARKWYMKKIVPHFAERNARFRIFEERIPHSEKVYSLSTIESANENYTHFITGSDQIWTFRWFNPMFFLDFVKEGKKRISYAASMGKSSFTVKEKDYLREVLPQFDAISVREDDLVNELNGITGCKVDLVVDPTLLLSREEWERVAGEKTIRGDYIFCYFLGDDPKLREFAKKFAKQKKLKLITIPFANESYNIADFFFGDEKAYAADPVDFLALIRGAKYVFTDSFHATVFSIVFEKNFVAFSRSNAPKMSSRLYSLTALYDCPERFITQLENMRFEDILELTQNAPDLAQQAANTLREKSMRFLMTNLKNGMEKHEGQPS